MSKLPKLFISHASKDRKFVERLTGVFQAHRLKCWYSTRHIAGAADWHDEIGKALSRCNWFVIVLTPAATKSKWVKRELLYALDRDAYDKRIIVLAYKRANDKKLSWALKQRQWVPFNRGFDQGCKALLKIWGKRHRPS